MELLVAYGDDPAGSNMARHLARGMEPSGGVYKGRHYDLAVIESPAISADWLDGTYGYDGYVFLSRHAAESGRLALTCHSTGNFAVARFGGNDRQVAVPHPHLQKAYLRALKRRESEFPGFEITIEATHHGPTAIPKPSMFVEVGTTEEQWNDGALCAAVADIVDGAMSSKPAGAPVAVCFGGTHYPAKFTAELLGGDHALGTVVPRHALGDVDQELFGHIMAQNRQATAALLDWRGMGKHKQKILGMLESTELEVVKV